MFESECGGGGVHSPRLRRRARITMRQNRGRANRLRRGSTESGASIAPQREVPTRSAGGQARIFSNHQLRPHDTVFRNFRRLLRAEAELSDRETVSGDGPLRRARVAALHEPDHRLFRIPRRREAVSNVTRARNGNTSRWRRPRTWAWPL